MFKDINRFGFPQLRRATVVAVCCAIAIFSTSGAASANPTISGSSSGPGGSIWLPNYSKGSVVELDPETLQLQQEIPAVGDHPLVMKAMPDGKRMFVGNFGPGNPLNWYITVIDIPSGKVVDRIPTVGAPYATFILSQDARYLFVPTSLLLTQVIDTQTLEVVRTIPVALPPIPGHIEVSPDNKSLYVMSSLGTLTKYDTETGAVTAPVLFLNGNSTGWGAMSADGNTLYAINFFSGVAIVDVPSWTVRTTKFFGLWDEPISATLTPGGKELWVCMYNSDEVVVLNAQTGAEVRRFGTPGEGAVYVGFSPDGKIAYLSGISDGVPLPYWHPLAGWYHAKQQAWEPLMTNIMNLDGSLTTYDTTTLQPIRKYSAKGALVAGIYPG
ncbi:hypothetical protein ACIP5Y_23545 [Nocardia sp. NPDC088792]|uniref:hypothetical protein n=1 Tax=Nocardia sp. NPDC088792 TaxID=3364332 RepID=UPI00382DC97E